MTVELNFNRENMTKHLPAGICAEIGVAQGVFSKTILNYNNPKKLYLIDAWKNFDLGYNDSNMVSDSEHQMRFERVTQIFSSHSNVEIMREMSVAAAHKFNDQYFDWIFIDADHTYDGCLADLRAYKDKVKDNGFICGHDWLNNGKTKAGFGVNQAVADFVIENDFHFVGHTNEPKWSSFVIAKSAETAEEFLNTHVR